MSAADRIWRHAVLPTQSNGENGKSINGPINSLKDVMVTPGLRSLILLAALALPVAPPAFAQANNDAKPADQQKPAEPKKLTEAEKWAAELAEAGRVLPAPAAKAECIWLGKRVINLLYRDDMDTAFRHMDIYDRFGCPGAHIQASFNCLVRQAPLDAKSAEPLDERVKSCWLNPSGGPAAPTATNAPLTPAPAAGTSAR